MKVLPPEIVSPLMEIISYVVAAGLGWLAKMLTKTKEQKEYKEKIKVLDQTINEIKQPKTPENF